ncbi:MAG: P-loop NTPase [Candidatus Micrarchaeia archaeon]
MIVNEKLKNDQKNEEIKINMTNPLMKVLHEKEELKTKLKGIKYKIGIYSAKGGVGKTTISINLAYSLAQKGLKVGLLDADIDCPNITIFLGINSSIGNEYPLRPIMHKNVKVLSTAMLVDDLNKPIIWRGPLIAKMITDFLKNTEWGDLDYLIIDLPPGTSDAPLSIMQLLDLSGFIIVTTPQKVSSINSIRSGLMARRLNMPIIGVIENFSKGSVNENTKMVASKLNTEVLGVIKNDEKFADMTDKGLIHVMNDKDIKETFDNITNKIENIVGLSNNI